MQVQVHAVPAVTNPFATLELERFFKLAAELGRPLTMFSGYIDDAWHSLMADEDKYSDFCTNVVGCRVEHIPSGSDNPIVKVEWLREYEARYGRLPKVWFADETGDVNVELYETYLATGDVFDAWKCSPAVPPIKPVTT